MISSGLISTAADIGPPTLEQLIAFLTKREIAMRGKIPIGNASKAKAEPFRLNNSIQPAKFQSNKFGGNKSKNSTISMRAQETSYSCGICQQPHMTFKCPDLKAQTIS